MVLNGMLAQKPTEERATVSARAIDSLTFATCQQRSSSASLIDQSFFQGRNVGAALYR